MPHAHGPEQPARDGGGDRDRMDRVSKSSCLECRSNGGISIGRVIEEMLQEWD